MRKVWLVRPQLVSIVLAVSLLMPGIVSPFYSVGGTLMLVSHAKVRPYVFPNGGRELFPRYRLVALYGTPGDAALGVLGAQDLKATITRVKQLAADYQPLISEHVLPTLELITTVASADPTDDGDYSYPISQDTVRMWVAAARKAGVYVVLDLQSGRSSFLNQAKDLQPLLEEPNVGLALDPEWRLTPDQKPLEQTGAVPIDEVNQTLQWLAALTRDHHLPQKLFLLHEFRTSMLPDRDRLDTKESELAYAIQMDGQGGQDGKLDTWRTITANPPANVHFGWKNFYVKDTTLRSPADTMKLEPEPWYVSYQ